MLTMVVAGQCDGRIHDKLDLAHTVATGLKCAVMAGEQAAAQRIIDLKFNLARDDVTFHMIRLINILGSEADRFEARGGSLRG